MSVQSDRVIESKLPAAPDPSKGLGPAAVKHASFQIPSLDGLRAISFLLVFMAHAGVEQIPGGFGVTVFFFLSGFLITTLMRVEEDRTGRISLKHFYLRRALRILPPFYIVLAAAIAVELISAAPGTAPLELPAVLSQVFHFSNYWIATHQWRGIASGTGVYWSLAVEEHFYLVFPALYVVLRRMGMTAKRNAYILCGLCALVFAWRCVLVMVLRASSDRTFLCSDTRFDSILFGCILALWNNPALKDSQWNLARTNFWRRYLFPAGLLLLLGTFVVRGSVFRETFRYTLQGLGLIPVFVTAIRCPEWIIFRPFNWKPMRFLGTLSYSLYLVHHTTLFFVARHSTLPRAAQGCIALSIAIAIAWGMYEIVEKPCAKLRKKLSASA
jgi:peptidoglycan/LPS O-acetylase OafA/YrhL